MTPTEQDKELRERLDIRSRLKGLSIFKLGFGFDSSELIEFILADRKRVALEARIDELNNVRDMDLSLVTHYRVIDRIAELKAQQEEV